MSMRRVVITGLGAVSPLGLGASHNWQRLLRAESGLSKITSPGIASLAVLLVYDTLHSLLYEYVELEVG